MHAVIRRYRVRLGTVEQAAHHAERGFLPLVRQIPGFVSCHLVDAGNDILACMAVFETPEGAAEAVRASREWFRDEWSSFRPVPPEVVGGEVLAHATSDRRRMSDRRRVVGSIGLGSWTGAERRAGAERRTEAASWAATG
ncbi:MAG TPA: hypothetical protein VF882_05785 [Gemmatimonadales bacterium]